MNNLEKELVDSDNLEIRTHADGTIVGVLKNVKKAIETRMTDLAKSGQLLAGRKLALFGDKGGGTTKLIIVLVHLANPNSRHNILVISIFGADDTAQNMLKYIPDVLDQLNSLETISFEQNGVLVTIDVEWMLGGDIKFLCSCHGHAGASSLEFCFFCYLVNRQCTQLRDYNGDAILRTVQSYANDALTGANSVQIGSVIIFKLVKLSHVIVPSLHILMGLADRYIFVFLLTLAAKEDNLTDIEFEKLSHTKSKMKEMVKNLDNKNNVLKTWISDKKSMEDMLLAVTSVISRKISKARNPPPTCHAGNLHLYT
ncbi:unnamed protein product [Caenorhabditis angaria]|uniref:Uncharacterized protein n=1 Tax=Caenorhabditis angaria TaxID=860376 RepID=A0A9P1J1C9_9PELO|nr:unnamed protein product [Caenorhabditis angaria]